jgi:transposase
MFDVNDDTKGSYRRIELLTGPGRRRRWSDAEKARIVTESLAPGACVSAIARKWHVLPQQVFGWRRAMRRDGVIRAPARAASSVAFVPIIAQTAMPVSSATTITTAPSIEIRIAGAVVRAAPGTDAADLTTVLRAVRQSKRRQ